MVQKLFTVCIFIKVVLTFAGKIFVKVITVAMPLTVLVIWLYFNKAARVYQRESYARKLSANERRKIDAATRTSHINTSEAYQAQLAVNGSQEIKMPCQYKRNSLPY